jgi:hypothetical protein
LLITFSQIADGGGLEPHMFGLTAKFNKMQKDTINHENPAIGNLLLYADFKTFFGDEIKRIAKNSWNCQTIYMSHFCRDGNEFKMWQHNGQLKFMFTDNSKPLYYKEMVKIAM